MTYRYTMNFSSDGHTQHNIESIITRYGLPSTIIEIGVYEGSTTFGLAEALSRLNHSFTLYAIDPHEGSIDLDDQDFNEIANNFVYNLRMYGKDNVVYKKKYSTEALLDLISANVSADFIYVDGDHTAPQVLTDLVLSWELLRMGGVILCDDATDWKYTDKNGTASAQMSPRMAIEMFIQCNWHKLEIVRLPGSSQTAFRKLKK